MIFIPYNRNIYIELVTPEATQKELDVLLPTDYQEKKAPYTVVRVGDTGCALDCQSSYMPGQLIVVEAHMIKEINYGTDTYHIILENYVLGELREVGN
jgi:co-chaperonin GroES (HSP10)